MTTPAFDQIRTIALYWHSHTRCCRVSVTEAPVLKDTELSADIPDENVIQSVTNRLAEERDTLRTRTHTLEDQLAQMSEQVRAYQREGKQPYKREDYLNGWKRDGATVLIGSSTHCAGCGRYGGTVCVVYDQFYVLPDKLPDWPFDQKSCPICELINHGWHAIPKDPLVERMKLRERVETLEQANRQLQARLDELTIPRAGTR